MKKITAKIFMAALLIITSVIVSNLFAGAAYAQNSHITLSDNYKLPGQTFTIEGYGFKSNETVSVIAMGEARDFKANDSGRFSSQSLTVPFSAIGSNQLITARGSQSNVVTSANLTVGTFYPVVISSDFYVIPGGTVAFAGAGFAPGERVALSGNNASQTMLTDSDGSFTTDFFTVPYSPGRLTYTFTGQSSHVSVTTDVTVPAADPYLDMNLYHGAPNLSLTIDGSQYGAEEKVDVSFGGTVLGTATTDKNGSFSLKARVPDKAQSGMQTVIAHGQSTGSNALAMFNVK